MGVITLLMGVIYFWGLQPIYNQVGSHCVAIENAWDHSEKPLCRPDMCRSHSRLKPTPRWGRKKRSVQLRVYMYRYTSINGCFFGLVFPCRCLHTLAPLARVSHRVDVYVHLVDFFLVNLPASFKGCCLNPKGWCFSAPLTIHSAPLGRSR